MQPQKQDRFKQVLKVGVLLASPENDDICLFFLCENILDVIYFWGITYLIGKNKVQVLLFHGHVAG